MSEGKIQVVVRSRQVPDRVIEVNRLWMSRVGVPMGTDNKRVVLYKSGLDAEHKKAIEEGRKLAEQLGLKLEIIDEAKVHPLRRLLASFGRGYKSPKLVIMPSYSPIRVAAANVSPPAQPASH